MRAESFWGGGGGDGIPVPSPIDAPASPDGGGTGPGAAPVGHTDTNVQEVGVDEPDFVKTDGQYMYVAQAGWFLVLQAWPAPALGELSRLEMGSHPTSLLVAGDTAIVFGNRYDPLATDLAALAPRSNLATATVIDLTDRANPVIVRELAVEGWFLDARMVNGRVYWVTGSDPWWIYNALGSGTVPPASELLPRYQDMRQEPGGASVEAGPVADCGSVMKPGRPNGVGMLSVFGLDLNQPLGFLENVTVLGSVDTVYGSLDSLVVGARNSGPWLWWGEWEPRASTVLHRFSLTPALSYTCSGEVDGWLLDSFSLSEYEDHLRVATTSPNWWSNAPPVNTVTVLAQHGEDYVQTGQVTGLGHPGETIQSVRFLEDRGFLVTFRQTDPLYSLDLSDPAAPAVKGELEVPGFSTYLHPVGTDHLLAVGRNTDVGSVDLSIFHVADLTAPTLVARTTLATGAGSEAQWDHKAFTYFADEGLLAIPVTEWSAAPWLDPAATFFSGLYLYDVDLSTGFSKRGTVDHFNFLNTGDPAYPWYYPEPVRRSFFLWDAITGPYLYSVSGRGVKATDPNNLAMDLGAIPLPSDEGFWIGPPVMPETP